MTFCALQDPLHTSKSCLQPQLQSPVCQVRKQIQGVGFRCGRPQWSSIMSALLLMHLGVHPRLPGFAVVFSPSEEGTSKSVEDTVCPDPSLSWLLLNSGSLGDPHWPAMITVYWLLLGPMSYAPTPCQDIYPLRGAGLSEDGLVEAADDTHQSAH